MASPRSGSPDAPTVTLISNTSIQWRSAIDAIAAVSRLRKKEGNGGSQNLQSEIQEQNEPRSELDDTLRQLANQKEETNQAGQLFKNLKNINPEVQTARQIEVLKLIRDDLVKQLDAYGLVLVLLAGITFVAILQPPGLFDNGKLQESLLVSLFMLLANLSFFIACTGLGAVMVGCAQLFRPFFYRKIAEYTAVSESKPLPPHYQGFVNWLLGCWEISPSHVAFDNIDVLAKLCIGNVYRIMRIRFYLGMALALCITAYICGALAVMVTNDRQRYLLVGAMGAGGVILIFEICITVSEAMKPESKSSDGSLQQPRLQQQWRDYTRTYGGHTLVP